MEFFYINYILKGQYNKKKSENISLKKLKYFSNFIFRKKKIPMIFIMKLYK